MGLLLLYQEELSHMKLATFHKLALLIFALTITNLGFGQKINPVQAINWPMLTGNGAPTAACTVGNYGQPYIDISTIPPTTYTCGALGWVLPFSAPTQPVSVPFTISASDSPNLFSIKDPNTGFTGASTVTASLQEQTLYNMDSFHTATSLMSQYSPWQWRVFGDGDSTAAFHSAFKICELAVKYGLAGFDLAGGVGMSNGVLWPQCLQAEGQTQNVITGTVNQVNGDFTRWVNGVYFGMTNSSSITFGANGTTAIGNILKIYYLCEPTAM